MFSCFKKKIPPPSPEPKWKIVEEVVEVPLLEQTLTLFFSNGEANEYIYVGNAWVNTLEHSPLTGDPVFHYFSGEIKRFLTGSKYPPNAGNPNTPTNILTRPEFTLPSKPGEDVHTISTKGITHYSISPIREGKRIKSIKYNKVVPI